jgi:hypothetical protein
VIDQKAAADLASLVAWVEAALPRRELANMLLSIRRMLLGLSVAAGLAFLALAQQTPPQPLPQPLPQTRSCDAFTKNASGDWVPKRDIVVAGPTGAMQIRAGQPVDDETQDRLDAQCK